MKDYRNMSCVSCKKPFDETSDIVICPECGAPHHRACWQAAGQCACSERHGADYVWEPDSIVIPSRGATVSANHAGAVSSEEQVVCPMCGNTTRKALRYCERCGYSLVHDREGAYDNDEFPHWEGLFDFNQAESIGGVPAGDIKRFIGGMWIYYIPRFLRMARQRGAFTFNFTAFLTHGLWFISRKMYGRGIFLTLLMTGTVVGRMILSQSIDAATGQMSLLLTAAYMLLAGIELLTMILCGIFGNRSYMNFCAAKIKKINAKATAAHATAAQFNEAMEEEGGVAVLPALSVGFCYLMVIYLLQRGL
ncbi:MAG: DUF2628 domain-containing protein [Clostridia bacterium]|nr:DUF2628 domain-containing protein [Clostridia bacterium]